MLNVATHSGSFHADDVFAFAVLRAATQDRLTLTRTRDAERLAQADLLFDVGGIYDPPSRRYDHHMRDKPLRGDGAPYSSAGLIWRDYGVEAVKTLLPAVDDEAARKVWRMLDSGLVRDVDLVDNGAIETTCGHFAIVIEGWNPTFAEPDRDENEAFRQASDIAYQVLGRSCARAYASVIAMDAVAAAAQAAADPRIIVLERKVPWEDAVSELALDQALYVVRPSGAVWSCNAVPPERGSFAQRLSLPEQWGGLRDAEFAALSGVADATFCHPALFICGAVSRDGCIELARRAIALGQPG